MQHWIEEFFKLYISNNRQEAYDLKHRNTPTKLYKYQPINDGIKERRMQALRENKLWFSKIPELNDPFDCQPTYFDEDKLIQHATNDERLDEKKIVEQIKEMLLQTRRNMEVVCFSESHSNMPLWGNYADNHKGICIEYDFSQLGANEPFAENLYPVQYEEYRYNITNLIKDVLNLKISTKLSLLFFLMTMKHKSWEYEKEWRIFNFDGIASTTTGSLREVPVKPSAIYLGLNCSKEIIDEISSIIDFNETKLFKLDIRNNQYFHIDPIE